PRVRLPPRPPGAQRDGRRARRLRARLLPAAPADAPLQPYGFAAAPGADRTPGGVGMTASARPPADEAPSRVDSLLESARSGLRRLTPAEAERARQEEGALLVDIRYEALRRR